MQQQRNTFIATTDGDKIYAINSISQDRTEVGITQKAAKELQDALANIIVERDELYDKCVSSGIIEKPKTTCDVEMLYKLMDIIKDTYEASKYAMEVADLAEHAAARKCELNPYVGMMAEHHDHPATPAK